ncbi:hypothetical protein HDV05_003761 [Chytridiales sp. JEL 0842]|nr:hypothetical protein HDV05_003761 [Chytridiales sp. JEL 0842]
MTEHLPPPLPTPSIPVTLEELKRAISLFHQNCASSSEDGDDQSQKSNDRGLNTTKLETCHGSLSSTVSRYQQAVDQVFQSQEASIIDTVCRSIYDQNPTNFATPRFKDFLLSRRLAPWISASINYVVRRDESSKVIDGNPPSVPATKLQLETAAKWLHAVAMILTSGTQFAVDSAGRPLETEQFSELFRTSRVPGPIVDKLVTSSSSTYVVVWYRGQPYQVEILDKQPSTEDAPQQSIASLSSSLDRDDWNQLRKQFIDVSVKNKASFGIIESSILTLALEDYEFGDVAELIANVRHDPKSLNRYMDQVVRLVIYKNGHVGVSVDHAPVDGGLVAEVIDKLGCIVASLTLEDNLVVDTALALRPIRFDFASLKSEIIPKPCPIPFETAMTYVPVELTRAEIFKLHKARLLTHTVNLSIQAACLRQFGTLNHHFFAEPTAVRHFARGRCDPSYSVTLESLRLITSMVAENNDENLSSLFKAAVERRKQLIKKAKYGCGVGPHQAVLREALQTFRNETAAIKPELAEAARDILAVWDDVFSGFKPDDAGIVFCTGFCESRYIEAAIGNVFAPSQLSCMYVGPGEALSCEEGDDRYVAGDVGVMLYGSGRYRENVKGLGESYKWATRKMANIGLKLIS